MTATKQSIQLDPAAASGCAGLATTRQIGTPPADLPACRLGFLRGVRSL
jgi:hypothetical protein